jgi:hypothetical protein
MDEYVPRSVRYLDEWKHQGWRLKVYGISAWAARPPEALVTAAKQIATDLLPAPATGSHRHGVGILGAHHGRRASFVFVSWWAEVYELNHFLFRGRRDEFDGFARVEGGVIGCTWDLGVIAFEAEAWVQALRANPDAPDLEAYLSTRYDGLV